MAIKSKIEWCTSSWNPWHGCHKVGPGCLNCYMFREMRQYGKDPSIVLKSRTTFSDPLKWKEPKKIFTCSWSDFFIEEADSWRNEAWEIIRKTPRHTYLILTKRPQRIRKCLPNFYPSIFRHVWFGVTIENQDSFWCFDELVKNHHLLSHHQMKCFISAEPLLGPITLKTEYIPFIDWIIVGGESGPNARPMKQEWAEDIRQQCREYDIPFFFKQNGGNKKIDGTWGGCKLYGQEYKETPWKERINEIR